MVISRIGRLLWLGSGVSARWPTPIRLRAVKIVMTPSQYGQ